MEKDMEKKSNSHILFIVLLVILLAEILSMCFLGFQIGNQRSFQKHLSLGDKYFNEANYEDAEIQYLKAIDIDNKNVTGYINLSYLYTETGQYDKAEEILERAQENINKEKHEQIIHARLEKIKNSHSGNTTEESQSLQSNENVQVLDGFTDTFTESLYNSLCCYHIPQIQVDGSSEFSFNSKLYNELYGILSQHVYDDPSYTELSEMVYAWGRKDQLISIVVETDANNYDWTEFYVYHFSLTTKEEATNTDILSLFGLSQTAYEELVRNTLQRYMEAWSLEHNSSQSEGLVSYNVRLEKTLAAENIKDARPFINAEGELCFVAKIYSPAGADYYYHMLNTTQGKEPHIDWLSCDIHQ